MKLLIWILVIQIVFVVSSPHKKHHQHGVKHPKGPKAPGTCPNGEILFTCFINPCMGAMCPANKDAKCVANYCGGCRADFYLKGKRVDCEEKKPVLCTLIMCPKCPPGMKPEKPAPGTKCRVGCKCVSAIPPLPSMPCPAISCPSGRFGNCIKIDGCSFCHCLPMCPPMIRCPEPCKIKTFKGCPVCECSLPPRRACPPVLCAMRCLHGVEVNDQGCRTCKCKPRRPIEMRPDQVGAPGTE